MIQTNDFLRLKKINIVKSFIDADDIDYQKVLEVIEDLFTEHESSIEEIKNQLIAKNRFKALNAVNYIVQDIRSKLFKKPCSKDYFKLIPTGESYIRYCTDCSKNVYQVNNEEDFEQRKNLGQCVAFNTQDFNPSVKLKRNLKACIIEYSMELGLPYSEDYDRL